MTETSVERTAQPDATAGSAPPTGDQKVDAARVAADARRVRVRGRVHAALAFVRRVPFTVALALSIVVVGIVTGGLVESATSATWYSEVAYGLPAFADGRWWTPVTGSFLVADPYGYAIILVLIPLGVGWLEWRRSTRAAVLWFVGGQLFALVATALALLIASAAGSGWASDLASALDVGPSGGVFACLAAAACSLPAPWRGRAQLVLAAIALVSVMFLGTVADLEHAAAVALVLLVNIRTLHAPTVRERRFIAFVALLSLGAVQIITSLVPTTGPFGSTDVASGSVLDVGFDSIVIIVIASGLHRGVRVAWVAAVALAVFNLLVGAVAVAALLLLPGELDELKDPVSLAAATATLWVIVLIHLIASRRAFRVRLRRRMPGAGVGTPEDVRRVIQTQGGGALSWMATWRDNQHFFGSNPSTFVAYQVHAGVAVALSDPISPPAELQTTVREFVDATERAGFIPCFFAASAASRASVPAGWRSLQVAEDTIVDLPGLSFTGKRWNTVRTAMNRAAREGVTFRLTNLADEPRSVRRQIDAISEQWVGEKGLPEMRFTLGGVTEALDPAVRLALAEDADGEVQGFLSWLPVFAPGGGAAGWTLDLMRRRDGGFPPVMEFLIAASAAAFRDEGAQTLSLSGAPLAHSGPPSTGAVEQLVDRLGEMLEPVYGFRSLHRFKQKFNPRAEPIFLLYHDEADLARIGIALTRAFLPDASVAQLAKAGAGAVRASASAG